MQCAMAAAGDGAVATTGQDTGRRTPGQDVLERTRTELAALCRRWKITELALFGSALRQDFGPASDIDLLVSFAADADWGLLDYARMEQELAALLGRRVDLVSRRAVERSANWIRRGEILATAQVVYAAR
jgi:predicted nucleotidyltransferase